MIVKNQKADPLLGGNVYSVNGLDVVLSEADVHYAKNSGVTLEEYARFKYLMEHTPRGIYSAEADPVAVLGVEARTPFERERFAKLFVDRDYQRREGELIFAMAVFDVAAKKDRARGIEKYNPAEKTGPVSSQLPGMKMTLTSLFLPADSCGEDVECLRFAKNFVASNSSSNILDIFLVGGSATSQSGLVAELGVNPKSLEQGDVNVRIDRGEARRVAPGKALPFALYRSDFSSRFEEL